VAAGRGAKGVMRPRQHCVGGGIWTGENIEFSNLAASDELAFPLQLGSDIFTLPNTS